MHARFITQCWLKQPGHSRHKAPHNTGAHNHDPCSKAHSEPLRLLVEQIQKHNIPIHLVGEKKLSQFGQHHQGVALECRHTPEWAGAAKSGNATVKLALSRASIHRRPRGSSQASPAAPVSWRWSSRPSHAGRNATASMAVPISRNRRRKPTKARAHLIRPAMDAGSAQGQIDRRLILVLDGLVDPHNLGAILRTSWLMGVEVVIGPSRRAVGLTPAVHKVACGGAEHVPLESVNNIKHSLRELQQQGFVLCGLSAQAPQTIWNFKLPSKLVWLVGAEAKGLKPSVQNMCDHMLSLPQGAEHASLNAAVALSMALFETRRQWSSTSS